ncbi:DUF3014 domain-containing protein [Pseudomaricurvus alkylphenolicus]|uniref:DUF3014 domain-containing protein n=1 Tax=Pseudomaricurvus alkylphenolicus TaxID=1306991 RepID=UPI00141FF691|nr:DUF3014 domain-containing protein [Pseudomaricurvus alkylphenolicus]NIB44574.1 DUF3014 domain-containing protein [Pseudomaricurvus alkylphenolicus]
MNGKSLALVFGIIVILGVYFLISSEPEQPATAVTPEAPAAVVEVPAEEAEAEPVSTLIGTRPPPEPEVPAEPLPPIVEPPATLDDSDKQVLQAVADLGPEMAQWLLPREQIRKWVLAVDLMADGKLPQRHRPLQYPIAAYRITAAHTAATENFNRVTPLIDAVTGISPKTLGRYYRAWLPTLEEAYGELGKPGEFQDRVDTLVERLINVPAGPVNASLKQPNVFYVYQDPSLERRSALEKWVWRMGDDNRQKLQAYLRELKFYL